MADVVIEETGELSRIIGKIRYTDISKIHNLIFKDGVIQSFYFLLNVALLTFSSTARSDVSRKDSVSSW